MEKIDKLDRQILEIISQNARIPFRDVAEQCGVSRAAIHQRVQRMIEKKVITGSGYHVNAKVLGYASSAYIGVKLEKGSRSEERRVGKEGRAGGAQDRAQKDRKSG